MRVRKFILKNDFYPGILKKNNNLEEELEEYDEGML